MARKYIRKTSEAQMLTRAPTKTIEATYEQVEAWLKTRGPELVLNIQPLEQQSERSRHMVAGRE